MTAMDPAREEFDLVDETGAIVGSATRAQCHRDPSLIHQAVHVFVVNGRGHVLLQRRASDKDIQPGKWDTSVGGHLARGETYAQAAVREAAEELGVSIEEAELVELHRYVWRSDVETESVVTYRVTREGPFTPQPDEIDDVRFFELDQLMMAVGTGLLTPNLEAEIAKCLAKGVLG
jgi:isopentenyl-diphosphate delta-isomerase type 1